MDMHILQVLALRCLGELMEGCCHVHFAEVLSVALYDLQQPKILSRQISVLSELPKHWLHAPGGGSAIRKCFRVIERMLAFKRAGTPLLVALSSSLSISLLTFTCS